MDKGIALNSGNPKYGVNCKKGDSGMGRRLLIILLIGVILTLLIPVTSKYYSLEQAFTPDNLIRVNSLAH